MTNRDLALNYLKRYQEKSLIPSFIALQSYMDTTYPGFLELWGKALQGLPQKKVFDRLDSLAAENGMSYPKRPDFNQIILDIPSEGPSVTKAIVEGTKDAVSDIGSGLKYAAIVAAILGAGYLAFQFGIFRKKA
jgi:hypothetical protein